MLNLVTQSGTPKTGRKGRPGTLTQHPFPPAEPLDGRLGPARFIMTQSTIGTYQLQGMSCGNCARHAEKVAKHIDGVADASVDLSQQTITITFDHPTEEADEAALLNAFDRIGYSAVTARTELSVASMKCNGCTSTVEKALKATPGVLAASFERAEGLASVKYWQGRTSPKALAVMITELGFPTTIATEPAM